MKFAILLRKICAIILSVQIRENARVKKSMKGKVTNMSLFKGPMREHLNGHKDLTEHKELIEVLPGKEVYVPIFAGAATNPKVLVKEGDKVSVGTKIAIFDERNVVPVFATVSGTVKGIQKMMHQSLKQVDHIVIENDELYTAEQSFGTIDWESATREELIEFMMNAGIIGCGGAGFPAYIKYKFAKDVEKLIINAVECEPFITSDYWLCEHECETMLVGIKAMKKMAQAKEALIAIKKSHPELIKIVREKIKGEENISVVEVPDVYPMGWERVLVHEITGRDYDRLPGEVGCVINNATTAYMFAKAMLTGEPIVSRVLTVSGDGVKNPVNARVRIGTRMSDVIAACGGYTGDNILLSVGGPMMGSTMTTDAVVVERQNNALTVQKNNLEEEMPCLRCGRCSDHCPSGLQPVRISQALKAKDIDRIGLLQIQSCIECGMCTYVCPSKIKVTESMRRAKRTFNAFNKK